MARINLRSQVQDVLPRFFGGTDNEYGAGNKWLLVHKVNDSGASLALGTLVSMDGGVYKAHNGLSTQTAGVIVGRIGTSGKLEEVACGTDETCAVAVAGVVQVLTTSTAAKGNFVGVSSTAGQASVTSTFASGTFGQVILAVNSTKCLALIGNIVSHSAPSGITGFATPAVVLGTAAAAGAATTVIRSDSTIVAFDATAPTTQAMGDSAATGSAAVAARRDHKHAMPSFAGTGSATTPSHSDHTHTGYATNGPILISDTPSTPLVFADLLQNDDQDDLMYEDIS